MPNRTLLIAGNWKMNNDVAEAAKLADELAQALPEVPAGVEVLVCPPTIDITTVHDRIQAAPIALGAQNVYWEAKGAFTGESSCDMLKSAGCTYCIIGHSERRDYFHETDEDQNKKAKALVAAGLVPVFCCGESLDNFLFLFSSILLKLLMILSNNSICKFILYKSFTDFIIILWISEILVISFLIFFILKYSSISF